MRLRHVAFAVVLVALILLAPMAGASSGRRRVKPKDRAATHTYLEAEYAYEQAHLAVAPAGNAATEALARRLEAECPGVLAKAPRREGGIFEAVSRPLSARQRGELSRQSRQLSELSVELLFALGRPSAELERPAALVFARAIRALQWSSATVTVFEHARAASLELRSALPTSDVCGDMLAWSRSGYKALTAATKALISDISSVEQPVLAALGAFVGVGTHEPLARYEGPAEKKLAAKVAHVRSELARLSRQDGALETKVSETLGVTSRSEAEQIERPRKGSLQIGHGRTAVGSIYTVWAEPPHPAHAPRGFLKLRCQASVTVEEHEPSREGGELAIVSLGSGQSCLSRSHRKAPSVECDEGRFTIEAQTLPQARVVQLHLSNGRTISSRVAVVPRRLGGPAGFYYQVVRGPSPVPLSLTELSARGGVLATLTLHRTERCVKRAFKREVHAIARGQLADGNAFTIVGERSGLAGHLGTEFKAQVASEDVFGGIFGGVSNLEAGNQHAHRSTPFRLQLQTGCLPHEYAIVFGVLSVRRDLVLVRSAGILMSLRHARIPASLHARGVLAYVALPGVPSEVIVRTPAGKTVFSEHLADRAREAREVCEGEAEA